VPWSDPIIGPATTYTNSLISWDPDSGNMNWFFQYTPNDMWDYDEAGTHILIEGQVAGQARKMVAHPARNGFLYALERANGQTVMAKPYVDIINWTAGIDQKTGKPVDYDPAKDVQSYSGRQNQTVAEPTKKLCPSMSGGNNFWPASYSPRTKLLYIPSMTSCSEVTLDQESIKKRVCFSPTFKSIERNESDIVVVDPSPARQHGERYPNNSGAPPRAGRSPAIPTELSWPMTTPLDLLWKVNGTGFSAAHDLRGRRRCISRS
jgi:alcohol dehydrogenase (cytochrome c)